MICKLEKTVISIEGEDAVTFINRLVTNDITKYQISHNYILNNKGRYLFDIFVFKISEEKLILIANQSEQDIIAYINFYKLGAKITIDDLSSNYCVFYSREKINIENFIHYKDTRNVKMGYYYLVDLESFHNDTKLNCDDKIYLEDKYLNFIPDNVDLIYEKSIPVEYGANELNSISYEKGCFVGQEVLSRIRYSGVQRKKLYGLESQDQLSHMVKKNDIVHDLDGTSIGFVCSAYQKRCIALLYKEQYAKLHTGTVKVNDILYIVQELDW